MAQQKKSWKEKFDTPNGLPKIIHCKELKKININSMLVPSPRQVEALMLKVKKGKLVTITELRAALARDNHTDTACPLTTGIFAWIVAKAAAEGASRAPYWRTLKIKGELNPKYPGGIPALTKKLQAEGHRLLKLGQRTFVANYQKSLAEI